MSIQATLQLRVEFDEAALREQADRARAILGAGMGAGGGGAGGSGGTGGGAGPAVRQAQTDLAAIERLAQTAVDRRDAIEQRRIQALARLEAAAQRQGLEGSERVAEARRRIEERYANEVGAIEARQQAARDQAAQREAAQQARAEATAERNAQRAAAAQERQQAQAQQQAERAATVDAAARARVQAQAEAAAQRQANAEIAAQTRASEVVNRLAQTHVNRRDFIEQRRIRDLAALEANAARAGLQNDERTIEARRRINERYHNQLASLEDQAERRSEEWWEGVQAKWDVIGTAAGEIWVKIQEGYELAKQGAVLTDLEEAAKRMGVSLDSIREASGNMVDDKALLEQANAMARFGLNQQEINDIFRASAVLYREQGVEFDRAAEAFFGATRGELDSLQNLGVQVVESSTGVGKFDNALKAVGVTIKNSNRDTKSAAGVYAEFETSIAQARNEFLKLIDEVYRKSGVIQAATKLWQDLAHAVKWSHTDAMEQVNIAGEIAEARARLAEFEALNYHGVSEAMEADRQKNIQRTRDEIRYLEAQQAAYSRRQMDNLRKADAEREAFEKAAADRRTGMREVHGSNGQGRLVKNVEDKTLDKNIEAEDFQRAIDAALKAEAEFRQKLAAIREKDNDDKIAQAERQGAQWIAEAERIAQQISEAARAPWDSDAGYRAIALIEEAKIAAAQHGADVRAKIAEEEAKERKRIKDAADGEALREQEKYEQQILDIKQTFLKGGIDALVNGIVDAASGQKQALEKMLIGFLGFVGEQMIAIGTMAVLLGALSTTGTAFLGLANPASIGLGAALIAAGTAMKAGSAIAGNALGGGSGGGGGSATSRSAVRGGNFGGAGGGSGATTVNVYFDNKGAMVNLDQFARVVGPAVERAVQLGTLRRGIA